MKYRAFDPFRALVVLSFTVVAAAACSTNVTNNPAGPGGSSGSAPVPTADCKSRCEAKATQCGAPSAKAVEGCNVICDGSYTSDQLACLEDKSCSELQSGSLSNVCPPSSLNGQCFKCADSEGVSKCSISTGPGPRCTSTDSSYCER